MDLEKTIQNLRKNEFEVSYFETAAEAAAYLDSRIDGKTVGFGDSETLRTMGVPVCWKSTTRSITPSVFTTTRNSRRSPARRS